MSFKISSKQEYHIIRTNRSLFLNFIWSNFIWTTAGKVHKYINKNLQSLVVMQDIHVHWNPTLCWVFHTSFSCTFVLYQVVPVIIKRNGCWTQSAIYCARKVWKCFYIKSLSERISLFSLIIHSILHCKWYELTAYSRNCCFQVDSFSNSSILT